MDATIDLTTRENCLVCGAYQSIAAGKPMVLSKTRALQTFFPAGAVYTDNSAADIRRCIEKVLADRERGQLPKSFTCGGSARPSGNSAGASCWRMCGAQTDRCRPFRFYT